MPARQNVLSNGTTTGLFYCLNAKDGSTVWTYEDTDHPGGYYWSGAIVYEDALYFTGDNGIFSKPQSHGTGCL